MNKLDAYVIMYLSEFMSFVDFVNLTRTAKEYREKLLTDYIQKRFVTETQLSISMYTEDNSIFRDLSRSYATYATHIVHSHTETTALCVLKPIILDDYYKDLYISSHETIEIELHTPIWKFHWSGNITLDDDIEDLRDQEFTIRIATTQFASIDMVLFFDSMSERIIIREIQISYLTKLQTWLRFYYTKTCVNMTIIAAGLAYICKFLRYPFCFTPHLVVSYIILLIWFGGIDFEINPKRNHIKTIR